MARQCLVVAVNHEIKQKDPFEDASLYSNYRNPMGSGGLIVLRILLRLVYCQMRIKVSK